jgi:hypothetical protein
MLRMSNECAQPCIASNIFTTHALFIEIEFNVRTQNNRIIKISPVCSLCIITLLPERSRLPCGVFAGVLQLLKQMFN